MTNVTETEEMNLPALSVAVLTLSLPFSCLIINLTILLKLLFKPHLWSLVNLFLSILIGIRHTAIYDNQ